MVKSPDAFRTISEVADWLGIQAHVLRFWESKFTQVKPIKRAGGRRYYRPADMLLLGGIKKLLHDDGLTIKGVQKILREEGMTHVAALSQPIDDMPAPAEEEASKALPETGVVLSFAPGDKSAEAAETDADSRSATPEFETTAPAATAGDQPAQSGEVTEAPAEPAVVASATPPQPPADDHPRATPDPLAPSDRTTEDAPSLAPAEDQEPATPRDVETTEAAPPRSEPASLPGFLRRPLNDAAQSEASGQPETAADSPADQSEPQPESAASPPVDDTEDTPRPAIIDLPDFTPEADFPARPGLLSRLPRVRRLPRHVQPQVAGLLLELAEMRQTMDAAMGAETNR